MSKINYIANYLKHSIDINKALEGFFDLKIFKNLKLSLLFAFIIYTFFFMNIFPENNYIKVDDPSYYTAALGIIKSVNIYNETEFIKLGEEIFGKSVVIWPYLYPPLFAELLTVFSSFHYFHFTKIFSFINVILCFLALLLIITILNLGSSRFNKSFFFLWILCLILFGNIPVIKTLNFGQVNFLVLDLILISFIFYKKDKYFFSSFFLAFAGLIKIYPFLFLLISLVQKKLKFLFFSFINCFGIIFISIGLFGINPWIDFIKYFLLTFLKTKSLFYLHYVAHINNNSLQSFTYQFFDTFNLPLSFAKLFTMFLLAIILAFSYVHLRRNSLDTDFCMSIIFLLTILISPISWRHHYTFTLFPLAFLIKTIIKRKNYIFFLFPLTCSFCIYYYPKWKGFPFNQIPLFGLLLLLFAINIVYYQKIYSKFSRSIPHFP